MSCISRFSDDDDDFAENIHGWAMKLGSLFTCVLRTCLKSPNDLTPSMKRIAVCCLTLAVFHRKQPFSSLSGYDVP